MLLDLSRPVKGLFGFRGASGFLQCYALVGAKIGIVWRKCYRLRESVARLRISLRGQKCGGKIGLSFQVCGIGSENLLKFGDSIIRSVLPSERDCVIDPRIAKTRIERESLFEFSLRGSEISLRRQQ